MSEWIWRPNAGCAADRRPNQIRLVDTSHMRRAARRRRLSYKSCIIPAWCRDVLICLKWGLTAAPCWATRGCWLSLPLPSCSDPSRSLLSCCCSLFSCSETKAIINPRLIYAPVNGIASDHKMYPGEGLPVCVYVCAMKINRPQKRQLHRRRQKRRWLHFVHWGKCPNAICEISLQVAMMNNDQVLDWREPAEGKEESTLWQGTS